MVERRRPFEGADSMLLAAGWITDAAAMALPPLTPRAGAGDAERAALVALQELVADCTAFDAGARPNAAEVLDRVRRAQRLLHPHGGGATTTAAGALAAAAASAGG